MRDVKRIVSALVVFMMVFSMSVPAMAADTADLAPVSGMITEVQKYGNITMNIKPKALYDAGYEPGDMLKVTAGSTTLNIPFCTNYSDVDSGSNVVRDDQDNNLLVVATNMGNFSKTYNVKEGDKVTFGLSEKAGYLTEYQIHQLKRSNDRSDYAADSVFANFRSITTTGIKPGVLYRSSSPVNNSIGRAAYADELADAAGIKAAINLADSDEEIKASITSKDFDSPYYKSLYQSGKVKPLNMGVDFASEEFGSKLADGLRFMINNDGPYLVHCTEGKDRAGFVSTVLECLMGAKLDEVVSDYMTTYDNYYGIKEGTDQYKAIAKSNVISSLTTNVCGLEKGADISHIDLADAAQNYLKNIGMTSGEIEALKAKLSGDSIYKMPNISGTVTEIEKYGHAVSDIKIDDFNKLGIKFGDMVTVVFDNGFVLEAPYLDGYFVDNGQPLVRAYPGQENIGICINYGKLNVIAKIDKGSKFTIMLTQPEGYLTQYEIRNLSRTNNRADYSSDEVFANFRNIEMGGIAKGVLYRSSSPVNNEIGRAAYADKLMKNAKVNTVVNLADSADNINKYMAADDFASPYYAGLYKNNHVLPLNMGLAYSSDEFKSGMAKGFTFMADNKGPYLFHCTEGKDRAGFFAVLAESLMGATKDQIVDDYMTSYANYYNIQKGTEKYDVISQDVLDMLTAIAGSGDLDKTDLSKAAENYLLSGGMKPEKIKVLKTNLSGMPSDTGKPSQKPENPASKPPKQPASYYIVAKGDCLWGIANRQLGNGRRYMEIFSLNRDKINNPMRIHAGQKLTLPKK